MPKTESKQQLGVRGEDLACAELERLRNTLGVVADGSIPPYKPPPYRSPRAAYSGSPQQGSPILLSRLRANVIGPASF
jgi:hypothetical protein